MQWVRHVYVTNIIIFYARHDFLKLKLDDFSWEFDKYKVKKYILVSLQSVASKVYWSCFVYTFFYDLRNVGPNPGSPMNYRFFCNRMIYNGKVFSICAVSDQRPSPNQTLPTTWSDGIFPLIDDNFPCFWLCDYTSEETTFQELGGNIHSHGWIITMLLEDGTQTTSK